MENIMLNIDQNRIATVIFNRKDGAANIMDMPFRQDLFELIDTLKACFDEFDGIILSSAKKIFFAGGDLNDIFKFTRDQIPKRFELLNRTKDALRWFETCGKPVVACINGAALGGGFEICLAAHARIAVDRKDVLLGQPEVTLGLMPGAGGIVRLVRRMGIQKAYPLVMEGERFGAVRGKELGLVDEVVASEADLIPRAVELIKSGQVKAQQPYDAKGYVLPGGPINVPPTRDYLMAAPSKVFRKTRGNFPAQEKILSVMVESAQVDIDTAMRIESRYFLELIGEQIAKNMLGFLWFESRQAKDGVRRPQGYPEKKVKKVAILGAGLMGGGIAYACATRGINAVLKDVSLEAAEKGKSYTANVLERNAKKGQKAGEPQDVILGRILATDKYEDCAGADLIIEAVFENRDIKNQVYREIEPFVTGKGVIASNTSTLPITSLAQSLKNQNKFIGMHFFSPVDRMELVELTRGKKTSNETIALAFDFLKQIDKTPILVNDSRGFFTTRVFHTFSREGVRMVAEGVPAALVENAAQLAGWRVGPLEVRDNVGLRLTVDVIEATKKDYAAEGLTYVETPAELLFYRMVNDLKRLGRAYGGGFYDWTAGQKSLWPGLKDLERPDMILPLEDVKDRMLYIQALEAVKILDEGVIETAGEANVGSILGIGFPRWTGGVIQFINTVGVSEFVRRARELAERYGERFEPTQSLKDMAACGKAFPHGAIAAQKNKKSDP